MDDVNYIRDYTYKIVRFLVHLHKILLRLLTSVDIL